MASGNGRSASVKMAFLRPQKMRQTKTDSGEITNVKCQIALVLLKESVASSLSLNGI